ncbi:MAG: 4-hydroxy-tetrahydrodipicolinate reductase [Thermomicrobiales bacterium]
MAMTVRIGIAGIRGRMGSQIATLAQGEADVELIGGISRQIDDAAGGGEPRIVSDAMDLLPDVDVLIDFTTADAVGAHATACANVGVPLVCGTTGLDSDQAAALRAAAEKVAVFHAANMSPAVNAALAVLPLLVRALAGYDIEIVETHHRYKSDAPSGTALALARVAAEASGESLAERAVYGREGACPRAAAEIGIHAVRSGGNPGEHAVILAGDGEEIRLSHRSFNREAYAQGALRAARLIVSQPPGWYEPATLPGFLTATE